MPAILQFPVRLDKADPSKERALPSVPAETNGFARIPHFIGRDRRLSLAARALVLALEFHGHTQPTCFPSNGSLADYLGTNERSVKRYLVELNRVGYVRLETVKPYRGNMTGRVIHLVWNEATTNGRNLPDGVIGVLVGGDATVLPSPPEQNDRIGHQRPTGGVTTVLGGRTPLSYKEEGNYVPEEEERNVTCDGHDTVASLEGTEESVPFPDSLDSAWDRLPGFRGDDLVNTMARWIAADLNDSGFKPIRKRVAMVRDEIAPVKRLRDAYEAAMKADVGKSTPGSVFMANFRDWKPRVSDADARANAKAKQNEDDQEAARAAFIDGQRDLLVRMKMFEAAGLMRDCSRFSVVARLDTDGILEVTTESGRAPGPMQSQVIALLNAKAADIVEILEGQRAQRQAFPKPRPMPEPDPKPDPKPDPTVDPLARRQKAFDGMRTDPVKDMLATAATRFEVIVQLDEAERVQSVEQ